MKKNLSFKDNYFNYFLLLYFFIGIFYSLNVGITHDEAHSNLVWELNKSKLSNIFLNTEENVELLDSYFGYYGIGFYLISTPLELLFSQLINYNEINRAGSKLLIKHPVVFIFFILSAIYFRKIILLFTKDKFFSNISTILFLTYPYLLGHSFFNVKDIPSMSIWLICTYFIIKIMNEYFNYEKIRSKNIILLAALTSYLISIRISGVLIFIEYLVFLIFYTNIFKKNLFHFLIKNIRMISIFSLVFIATTFLFNPNFWDNPLKFFKAISFMSQHIQTVCTITLGDCMKAQNLPSSYLFIWLFFKLPLIILFGLSVFPFIEKKLFTNKENLIIIGSLSITVIIIMLLLILFNVNLYDELRQVLFLIPLIFIISLILMFNFKKKLGLALIGFSIIFFLFQNIKLFPYNYIWLNNSNIFMKVSNNFELDYWGVSTKNVANFINSENLNPDDCIISNTNDRIIFFLNNSNQCFKPFNELHKKNERPFYVALTERATNKGVPNKCELIHSEQVKMNFSKEDLILAKIFKCS